MTEFWETAFRDKQEMWGMEPARVWFIEIFQIKNKFYLWILLFQKL